MRKLSLLIAASLLLLGTTCVGVDAGLYGDKSPVVQLTPDNFNDVVLKSDGLWLVEFYAPWCGHCKALTPEWEKAAKALKGHVHIAAVDADAHKSLGETYKVDGFPTIKIFGADKSKPTDFTGGRKADDIVTSALAALKQLTNSRLGIKGEDDGAKKEQRKDAPPPPPPAGGFYEGTDVVELTDDTFETEVVNGKDAWLIEFYAPWCGHCKSLAPEWKKAATALAGTMKIGAMDATVHRKWGDKYKVQGFPTIKFVAPGKAEEPEDYNGGRTTTAIVEYCNKKAELYPGQPPQVLQVATNEDLASCYQKTMCVVFVVPHVIDTGADGRNKLIEMFVQVAAKMRARGVAFAWIVGGEHPQFEEAFGVISTYPTFIAINEPRKRFATHRGRFDLDGIVAGIAKVLDGKIGITQLQRDLPKLSPNVPLWDGKDYVASDE